MASTSDPKFVLGLEVSVKAPKLEEGIKALMADVEQLQQQVSELVSTVRDRLSAALQAAQEANTALADLRADDAVEDSKLEEISEAVRSFTEEITAVSNTPVPPEVTPDTDDSTTVGGDAVTPVAPDQPGADDGTTDDTGGTVA